MTNALTVNQTRALAADELYQLSQQFKHYPYLERDEEYALAQRVQENGDKEAAQALILAHMRYVIKTVKGYLSYGLPARDLVQEGTVGLMKAVKNYNPSHDVRLVSYATHWIKAEIHEYILKNWRLVKVATTKAQRKLFFNLKKLRKQIGHLQQQEAEQIAEKLDVSANDVMTMEQRINGQDTSYDGIVDDDDENPNQAPSNLLSYQNDNPEQLVAQSSWFAQYQTELQTAIHSLKPREQMILQARWLTDSPRSLKDLGNDLGISLERVRQLEKIALDKLRRKLQDLM